MCIAPPPPMSMRDGGAMSIPSQRACVVDRKKTPSFGFCQVDMYGSV